MTGRVFSVMAGFFLTPSTRSVLLGLVLRRIVASKFKGNWCSIENDAVQKHAYDDMEKKTVVQFVKQVPLAIRFTIAFLYRAQHNAGSCCLLKCLPLGLLCISQAKLTETG